METGYDKRAVLLKFASRQDFNANVSKARRGAAWQGYTEAKVDLTQEIEQRAQQARGGIQCPRKWIYVRRFCAPCSRSVTI